MPWRVPTDRVTFAEAARILGLSMRSVSHLLERGKLETVEPRGKPGRLPR